VNFWVSGDFGTANLILPTKSRTKLQESFFRNVLFQLKGCAKIGIGIQPKSLENMTSLLPL